MSSIGKRTVVLLGSSLFGYTLWLVSFTAITVGSAHLTKDISPGGGVFVIGGGFIVAGTLGIGGAVYTLRRFRPKTISK